MTTPIVIPVITVDGPSGSGKGTITSLLAAELKWNLLDSGALYRLVALGALKHQIDFSHTEELAKYAKALDIRFDLAEANSPTGATEVAVVLEGKVVGDAIRTEECGNNASKIAALPEVRAALLERQRQFLVLPGLIADGRDMGTVVFPYAGLKIYLTASADERAKRRFKQLKEKGISAIFNSLVREINERDARDMNRPVAPLKPAEDAHVIDTSSMPIDKVIQHVLGLYRQVLM
ncbi:(d)CMP kinase [Beggiatoa alba]|nr:(d)CMP kinase [Beggiatoa alba]